MVFVLTQLVPMLSEQNLMAHLAADNQETGELLPMYLRGTHINTLLMVIPMTIATVLLIIHQPAMDTHLLIPGLNQIRIRMVPAP